MRNTGNLVLTGGRIITMDAARPAADAIAIGNGRILAVGAEREVRAIALPGSEHLDLRGRTATPGLNDAHAHPMIVGFARSDLNIATPPVGSIAEIVKLVAQAATSSEPSRWIVGRGYDQARLSDQRHPMSVDLDPVAPNHPVLLLRACHHIGVANSVALKIAEIDRSTADPDGGTIDRGEDGEPTGIVRETALELVQRAIPAPDQTQIESAIMLGLNSFLESGVTSTVEAVVDHPDELRAYQSLWRRGELPVRTYLMMIIDDTLDEMIELGIQTGLGDDLLRIGPAKLFSDGSIGGRTARLRLPYVDQPDNYGLWMQPPEAIKALVKRAHSAGFQIGIHAIGDAAIDLILDAYEEAQRVDPRPDPRHRIEHCSIVDEATIERIARLGVIPIPGTSFLYYFRDAYIQNLGLNRLRYAYGMKSFLRHGVIAAASTDAPIVPTTATIGLQTMMTRRDIQGRPVWPEEAIGLHDAIRAYTVNGAYASFEENRKGALRPGLLGDITVFETDLESVPAHEIGSVGIDHTILGGNVAFSRTA